MTRQRGPTGASSGRSVSTNRASVASHAASGHAAMPHECVDPIPVACEIVTALNAFIARTIPVSDPAVLSITKIAAGSAYNIVPSEVTMLGTLRTLSPAVREKARAGLHRVAEHVALAHQCTAEVRIDEGYPVTMNDARAITVVRDIAEEMAPQAGWMTMPAPMMGGEDFSYVLREVPGCMAFIGVAPEGSDPATNPPLHNTRMTIEEGVMAKGIALHCAFADRVLQGGLPG